MNTPLDITPSYTVSELRQQAACCVPQAHLAIHNLSVSYGRKTVLRGVSLDIQRGCITALIGPSGCGKTSFLSSFNRLVDMVPGVSVSGRSCCSMAMKFWQQRRMC